MSTTRSKAWLKSGAIILLSIVLVAIVRPALRGLASLAADAALAVALLLVIYVTLKKHGLWPSKAGAASAEKEADTPRVSERTAPPGELPPPESPRSPSDAERSAEVDAELREIKRKLGKD